ncbi:hypothetical protein [Nocardia sp. MW-W600-9]
MTTIRVQRAAGIVTMIPQDAPTAQPTVLDDAPTLDVLVLDVVGGHLTWSLLADQPLPAAVLDDPDSAQDWLWAVYGEEAALTVADGHQRTLTATPLRPELAAALRRLAYAHWATRWWPASTVDGIPALDPALLSADIDELTEACDMALDAQTPTPLDPLDAPPPKSTRAVHQSPVRADDYALAAGGPAGTGGLVLARGSGECDWRRCPPGIVDAGSSAVSWQLTRADGASTVQVSVVAAPGGPREVPEHLRPRTRITAGADVAEVALRRHGDAWVGTVRVGEFLGSEPSVEVFVPGVGPAYPQPDETSARGLIRDFARQRLAGSSTGESLLGAEAAAAEDDSDF